MREQAGLAVIQERAQIHAGVPVGREIIDSAFRQDSLKTEFRSWKLRRRLQIIRLLASN